MNLQQHENSTEANAQGKAWYRQPETTHKQAAPSAPVPVPKIPPQHPERFEPAAAERILARAGALQEVHGQLLSAEQLEAIAAEMGIQPEFVHLAIEQEKNSAVLQLVTGVKPKARSLTKLRVITTLAACALVAAVYTGLNIESAHRDISTTVVIFAACVFPLKLSLWVGAVGRSRRWGTVSGLAIALTAIAICLYPQGIKSIDAFSLWIFAGAIASSTLFGVAGAELRRVMSKRQTSNRSKRRAIHQRAQDGETASTPIP